MTQEREKSCSFLGARLLCTWNEARGSGTTAVRKSEGDDNWLRHWQCGIRPELALWWEVPFFCTKKFCLSWNQVFWSVFSQPGLCLQSRHCCLTRCACLTFGKNIFVLHFYKGRQSKKTRLNTNALPSPLTERQLSLQTCVVKPSKVDEVLQCVELGASVRNVRLPSFLSVGCPGKGNSEKYLEDEMKTAAQKTTKCLVAFENLFEE